MIGNHSAYLMASTHSGASTFVEAIRGSHGAENEQETTEVCPQGVPQGNVSPLKVVILLSEFYSTCSWLENHTLVGYYFDHIPRDSIICTWIQQTWHGIKVDGIQNLTKVFFLFHFVDPTQARTALSHGSWSIYTSLLVFHPWTKSFSVTNQVSLMVPIWVEFLGLPLPLWLYHQQLCASIGEFICCEIDRFYASLLQTLFCVKVDLSKNLKEYVNVQVGDHHF